MLRKVISDELGVAWNSFNLTRTEKGKPVLKGLAANNALSFNVAHQGDYVVLAAETEVNCAIDVMEVRRPGNLSIAGTIGKYVISAIRPSDHPTFIRWEDEAGGDVWVRGGGEYVGYGWGEIVTYQIVKITPFMSQIERLNFIFLFQFRA